jgi:Fur family ferric uptake transcriptional regulator
MPIYKTELSQSLQDFISSQNVPISGVKLVQEFSNYNKSTVYRQLEKMIQSGFLKSLEFGIDKKTFYELNKDRHSHFICKNCNYISCLKKEFITIALKSDFDIEEARLFGLCKNCITKQ